MNYYVTSVKDFMSDGNVVPWLSSKVHLVVNDKAHVND